MKLFRMLQTQDLQVLQIKEANTVLVKVNKATEKGKKDSDIHVIFNTKT